MNDFKELFLRGTHLLDLRSPIEYAQGAFPNSTNIPLLTNKEREIIGTCYKQHGEIKAVELGHKIVSGETKRKRIEAWKGYFNSNPKAQLYCFRGGMRSHLVQQWLKQSGVDVHLVEGGYKAMRRYLIDTLEQPLNMIRISGQTGVGKTELLLTLDNHMDLEGLAHHRGSAFGRYIGNQPSQIDFENKLAIEIIKKQHKSPKALIIEDESRYIGSINLPHCFSKNMQKSPVLILTCPQEQRINRIYHDYVDLQKRNYIQQNPNTGSDAFNKSLMLSLEKIKKRLGGARYKQLHQTMQTALQLESESLHKQWIAELLETYYDPMYDYQINKKSKQIILTGTRDEVKDYFMSLDSYSTRTD